MDHKKKPQEFIKKAFTLHFIPSPIFFFLHYSKDSAKNQLMNKEVIRGPGKLIETQSLKE
jgi:hypothetical protein